MRKVPGPDTQGPDSPLPRPFHAIHNGLYLMCPGVIVNAMLCTVPDCGRPAQAMLCSTCLLDLVADLKALTPTTVPRVRIYEDRHGAALKVATTEEMPGLLAELETTITRQDKIGSSVGVWIKGKEMPLSFKEAASEVSYVLTNTIVTWARDLVETYPELEPTYGSVGEAAEWLAAEQGRLALHPAAAELHGEITYAVQQAKRIIDRLADRIYVGPCDGHGAEDVPGFPPCGSDVFGKPEMSWARCSVCGREYEVAARRAWMLTSLENHLGSSTYVAAICTGLGVKVSASTIRMWVKRHKLQPRSWVAATPGGKQRPMYRVGDVVAVAAGQEIASYAV